MAKERIEVTVTDGDVAVLDRWLQATWPDDGLLQMTVLIMWVAQSTVRMSDGTLEEIFAQVRAMRSTLIQGMRDGKTSVFHHGYVGRSDDTRD